MHVTTPFGLVFPASYDEYTALVKKGNVASEHVRSSQWNVSLVKPGYRDLLSYVTVFWLCGLSSVILSARVNWCSCASVVIFSNSVVINSLSSFLFSFSVISVLRSARCMSLLSEGVVE